MKVMSTIIAVSLLGAAGAAGKSDRGSELAMPNGGTAIELVTAPDASAGVAVQEERSADTEWRYSPAVPYVAPKVPI